MALDLFKLLGTIEIDNDKANEALRETSKEGEESESKLGQAFSKIGKGAIAVGKTIATGLAVGATAFAGLAAKALSAGGELEQNMGGSEAVFGEYAAKMQDTAKTAFSNMGLSTSDYLATANKMGALFQGAGFDIEESMNLSSEAMQRAADVASIMGIDTGSAMEAIAGAAKGNFTMMDNLGVAMNDTTIQAYALSKGIDKSTSEMTNQEKIALAMEMFMEKTAYATGNYAKENETLAGSLGTAKAALTNFLDGSGSVEDLVSSFGNLANVAVSSLQEILPRLVSGVSQIAQQVIPMLPGLLQKLLPSVIDGAAGLINGLVAALPSLLDFVLNSALPQFLSGILTITETVISALPSVVESIASALPTLIPLLISGLASIIVMLCDNLMSILQPIFDNLPDIIISLVSAICENLPLVISGLIRLVLGIVAAIPEICSSLADATPVIVEMVVTSLLSNLPLIISGLIQVVVGIVKALPRIFVSLVKGVVGIFTGIWAALKNVLSSWGVGEWINTKIIQPVVNFFKKMGAAVKSVWDAISNAIKIAIKFIGSILKAAFDIITLPFRFIWENCKEYVFDAFEWIKKKISAASEWISSKMKVAWGFIRDHIVKPVQEVYQKAVEIFEKVKTAVSKKVTALKDKAVSIFTALKTKATEIFNSVKEKISAPINSAKEKVQTAIQNLRDNFVSKANALKTKVSEIFNSVKEKMSAPIQKARDTIKGIVDKIKGFFSGMKLNFPNIKLPHFSLSPSGWKIGDLLKGDIPKLSIDWYAKAMNDPMIMTSPTIFGYDASTGQLMGGGEAGSEVVTGTNTLMKMIQAAVAAQNDAVVKVLTAILNAIVGGNQETLRALLADKTFKVGEREFARLVREYA